MRTTAWLPAALLAGLIWVVAAAPAAAESVRHGSASPEQLRGGEADGVAIDDAGGLTLSPRLAAVAAATLEGSPQQIWDLAADGEAGLWAGCGPAGQLLRFAASGRPLARRTLGEPLVTALARMPDGALVIGTSPEGRIYRLGADDKLEPWAETGARYVWDLAVGRGGELHAATGEPGSIVRLRPGEAPATLFDAPEPHLVSLAHADDGWLAGGAGRGGIYRIDLEGHGLLLHEDRLPEATALLAEPGGSVIAALLAPAPSSERRPELRLRLPDGTLVGTPSEGLDALEERRGPTIRGTIEGLEEGPDPPSARARGRLLRILPTGATQELWSAADESPLALERDAAGRLLFGTGEPARLYRLSTDDRVELLATMAEAQVTALLATAEATWVATSNPAALYRLDEQATSGGVYLSPIFDAGAVSRWGSLRWSFDGPTGLVELYTRTGNGALPDQTWSGWSPAMTNAAASPVINPDGRYLQWRARFLGSSPGAGRLTGVTFSYVPHNRAPLVRRFRSTDGAVAVSGDAEFEIEVEEPDGDRLRLELDYRRPGAGSWAVATVDAEAAPEAAGERGPARRLTWRTAEVDEGRYELRLRASDAPGNPPGEAAETIARLPATLVLDRTAPRIELRRAADGQLEIDVLDELSGVARLEWIGPDGSSVSARPVDGVCDSGSERFRLAPPAAAAGRLRATDRAGNRGERAPAAE